MNKIQYYALQGKPAYIESLLTKPLAKAQEFVDDAFYQEKNSSVVKIGEVVAAVFLLLTGLPLRGIAHLMNLIFRERIKQQTLEEEFKAWSQVIVRPWGEEFDPIAYTWDEIILDLIRLRMSPSECKYKKILVLKRSEKDQRMDLLPDGQYCCAKKELPPEGKEALILLWYSDTFTKNLMNETYKDRNDPNTIWGSFNPYTTGVLEYPGMLSQFSFLQNDRKRIENTISLIK